MWRLKRGHTHVGHVYVHAAPTHKPAVNDAKHVCQSQVTNVNLREVTGNGELGSREIEDKAKLSMMPWNVCGWCKEGGGLE